MNKVGSKRRDASKRFGDPEKTGRKGKGANASYQKRAEEPLIFAYEVKGETEVESGAVCPLFLDISMLIDRRIFSRK